MSSVVSTLPELRAVTSWPRRPSDILAASSGQFVRAATEEGIIAFAAIQHMVAVAGGHAVVAAPSRNRELLDPSEERTARAVIL